MSAASLVVKRLLEKKPKTRQDIPLIKLEVARSDLPNVKFLRQVRQISTKKKNSINF